MTKTHWLVLSTLLAYVLTIIAPGASEEKVLGSMPKADCNASHFDYLGIYALGKRRELNTTFTYLQEQMPPIDKVTYLDPYGYTYEISNIRPRFYLRETKERVEILANDVIVIFGGSLQADIKFNWLRNNTVFTINGSGSAFGVSNQIPFANEIVVENDGYGYQLMDYDNVSWDSYGINDPFQIYRVDPPVAQDFMGVLTKMFNKGQGHKSVKTVLEEAIAKQYKKYLNKSIIEGNSFMDPRFNYTWASREGVPGVTIPMRRKLVSFDVQKSGIQVYFDIRAQKDEKWQCGRRIIPDNPINPQYLSRYVEFTVHCRILQAMTSMKIW